MRPFAAVLLVALAPAAAHAKLEIRDIQASHGQLGPERTSGEYVAGDHVYFRYVVEGVRTDGDGRTRAEFRLTVVDANKKVLRRSESPFQEVVGLGGGIVPASAGFALDEDFPPGDYELVVEFADLIAKESASFRRKVTVRAEEFALLQVRFYQDAAGQVPARVGGTVSQTLLVKMKAVGFDRSAGEIDVEMEIQVLDPKGNPVTPKPIRAVIHNEKPEEVKQIDRLGLSGLLILNRPGDFVFRVTLTDKMAKKKVSFEAPMRVAAP